VERLSGRYVLADAGPLYATLDPSDQYHERAVAEGKKLVKDGYDVAVAYPTLQEVHSLVLYRLGHKPATKFLREAEDRSTFLVPTDSQYGIAIERLSRYPDQSLSMADAVVGVLAEQLHLSVWTYDHHFDIMRIPVWRP
jgi:predicted nucleic acid-binding protein